MSSKNETFSHGDSIGGSYAKWLLRDVDISMTEFLFLMEIANETLFYRKKYAYIESSKFSCSKATRNRLLKKLKEKNLLKYVRTSAYTMYQLVLPKELDDKIKWFKGEKLNADRNDNKGNKPLDWLQSK